MPSGSDAMKIRRLLEERERKRLENADKLKMLQAEEKMKPQQIVDKFSTYKDEVEDQLRASTVGLVSLKQMKEKTNKILEDRDLRAVKDRATQLLRQKQLEEAKEREKMRKRKNVLSKLSFGDDHEDEDSDSDASSCGETGPDSKIAKKDQKTVNAETLRDKEENRRLLELINQCGTGTILKNTDHLNVNKKEEELDANQNLAGPSTKPDGDGEETVTGFELTDDQKAAKAAEDKIKAFETLADIEQQITTDSKRRDKESRKDKIKRIKMASFDKIKNLRNNEADSSYLPNAAKNEDELEMRKELREEWERIQNVEKNAVFNLPFLYWDGCGHPYEVTMKKGNTIHQFVSRALDFIMQDFPDLGQLQPEQFIFVKDDLILPHYYTFYDLVQSKIVSQAGNLLNFDTINEEAIMQPLRSDKNFEEPEINTAIPMGEKKSQPKKMVEIFFTHQGPVTVEVLAKDNIGRVIARTWYEKNKHIYPASKWEAFDPVSMVKVDTLTSSNDKGTEDYYKRML